MIKGIENIKLIKPEEHPYLEKLYEVEKYDYIHEHGKWKKNEVIINESIHKLKSLKVRSEEQDKMLKRLEKMKKQYYQKS